MSDPGKSGSEVNKETAWDERLHIRTSGRDDTAEDAHHHPYEPTPYAVLERLAESGLIGRDDVVLDYGCGKGRAGVFLAAETGCRSIGVDFEESFVRTAAANARSAGVDGRAQFLKGPAETFDVPADVTCCYFFNPFSERLLPSVLSRVEASWYARPRLIRLLFYYPSDAYIALLMQRPRVMFEDELDCSDLFPGDPRERVMSFVMAD